MIEDGPECFPFEDSSQLSRRFATKRCPLLASKVGSSILLRLAVGEEMCSPCWPSKKKVLTSKMMLTNWGTAAQQC